MPVMQMQCRRTHIFYHVIHCEVEFEVWIYGLQVYPGTLSCCHLAFHIQVGGLLYSMDGVEEQHGVKKLV